MKAAFAPFVALSALLIAPSAAAAESYVSLQAGLAYQYGFLNWASPSYMAGQQPETVTLNGRTSFLGPVVDVAVGIAPRSSFAIAGELSTGVLFGGASGIPYSSPNSALFVRGGIRGELRGDGTFVRLACGVQQFWFGGSGQDIAARENVWMPEPAIGPYVAATAGLRGDHVGGFARLEVARTKSEHATFTPITMVVGMDVAWF